MNSEPDSIKTLITAEKAITATNAPLRPLVARLVSDKAGVERDMNGIVDEEV
jgi:hypothetical protein